MCQFRKETEMKFLNDIEGNYHSVRFIETIGTKESGREIFPYYIFIRMNSGKEYIIGEYISFDEAYNMLEEIIEEITQQ